MQNLTIRGAGGGGSSSQPRAPYESPDTLHSEALIKILDLVSEGEIVGFSDQANPLSCVYLSGTPVANSDGSLNFTNVQIDSRVGTQTQDPPYGFDGVESENLVGVELTSAAPWSQALTNTQISAVRIRIDFESLQRMDNTTGDVYGYKIDYKIQLSTDGSAFEDVLVATVNGKASDTYERVHTIDLPKATTGWTVKVVRTTANSTSQYIQDTTRIASYAEIVYGKFRMPNTAWVSLVMGAKQFNNVPDRAYDMMGRIIQVPSNYDPDTRVYTGVWDGTFQLRYSTNPAWAFYDMVTHTGYGLGKRIPPENVDKWALYTIAQYCDEMVDDGFGGTEPRFQCNLYLQKRGQAARVLQDMATMFRGIMYAAAGAVVPVADMPSDPVYLYNQTNVVDGRFTYTGSSKKVRHTVALVSWNDLNDMGRAKVEYVEDKDGIARYGVQQLEITAVGCSSRGQAHRLGKYALATERFETDGVAFSVGLDGTVIMPGKIVKISDPLRAGRRTGGRVRSATISSVTVDQTPTVVAGDTITVILPTALPQEREVLSVVGNQINVTPNFSQVPLAQSVWLVESSDLQAQTFRILSVKENTDGSGYDIVGIQHVPDKFDFVDFNVQIEEPPITASLLLGPPSTVTLSDFERVTSNIPALVLAATWPKVAGAAHYEIQLKRNDNNWTPPVRVESNRYELEGAVPGVYVAKVSSVNTAGYTSAPRLSAATPIETANFTIVNDLQSSAGVLTINCALAEQFKLLLIENITSVLFTNVSSETTVIIEIHQTGDFTITWPASVTPVSGIPYEVSLGGTVLNPKIDTVGLHTDNKGVNWHLRVDKQDNPAAGGTGGSFKVVATPNPAYDYAAANPSVAIAASTTGGVGAVTYAWSRAPGGVGDWSGSTGNTGGPDFTCSSPTGANPTFSRTGTTDGYVAQNWRLIVTDSSTPAKEAQVIVEITLEDDGLLPGGSGGPTCVSCQALMPDGRIAKDIKVGTRLLGVNPETLETVLLLVSYSQSAMSQCVKLVFADGTELTCSTTAPIPTLDGLVNAIDMQGHDTVTLVSGTKAWTPCVQVVPVGLQEVQHITCENGVFFAGDIKGFYAAHHNLKWEPIDP